MNKRPGITPLLNVDDLYKNIGQLPQEEIDLFLRKVSSYESKLATDFKTVQLKIPTMEKKFLEIKILHTIGAISSSEFIGFRTQLQNAQDLVANHMDYVNAASFIRRELGKLRPPSGPRINHQKSDEEREAEQQPRAPLSISREGTQADKNRIENGACYSPVPGEGQEE